MTPWKVGVAQRLADEPVDRSDGAQIEFGGECHDKRLHERDLPGLRGT